VTLTRRTPLRSRTPLRRRRAAPRRRVGSVCTVRGCTTRVEIRISEVERLCKKHAVAAADAEARAYVRARDPACVACGRSDRGVQWAHVHSRGMRYVRWDADNAVGLCSGCHYAYTKSSANWTTFVERRWPGLWTRLLLRNAYCEWRGGHVDLAAVIETYRSGGVWNLEDPDESWRTSWIEGAGTATPAG